MKKFLLVTAAIMISSTAYAADAIVEEVPVAVQVDGFSWTGFYLGIKGGYGWGNADYTAPLGGGASFTSNGDVDGFLIGGYAGAQYQFSNNVVLGAEIDVDYRNGDDTANYLINPPGVDPFGGTIGLNTEMNWTGSARLRAGYAMDRWMPYVTGGFAFADYDAQVLSFGAPIPGTGYAFSETSVGWTAGVGAEYAFTDNIIFRAEYRYSDFGKEDVLMFFPAPVPDQTFELDTHDVTLGVSWKF